MLFAMHWCCTQKNGGDEVVGDYHDDDDNDGGIKLVRLRYVEREVYRS